MVNELVTRGFLAVMLFQYDFFKAIENFMLYNFGKYITKVIKNYYGIIYPYEYYSIDFFLSCTSFEMCSICILPSNLCTAVHFILTKKELLTFYTL